LGWLKTADYEKNQRGFHFLRQLKGHPVFLINILHNSSYLYINGRPGCPAQEAVAEKLKRLERTRLARECAKLDPDYEQKMAEEGFSMEINEWPKY
jgi:hypothetical protein